MNKLIHRTKKWSFHWSTYSYSNRKGKRIASEPTYDHNKQFSQSEPKTTHNIKEQHFKKSLRESQCIAWHLKDKEKRGFVEIWPPILFPDHLSTPPHWLCTLVSAAHISVLFISFVLFSPLHECLASTCTSSSVLFSDAIYHETLSSSSLLTRIQFFFSSNCCGPPEWLVPE